MLPNAAMAPDMQVDGVTGFIMAVPYSTYSPLPTPTAEPGVSKKAGGGGGLDGGASVTGV